MTTAIPACNTTPNYMGYEEASPVQEAQDPDTANKIAAVAFLGITGVLIYKYPYEALKFGTLGILTSQANKVTNFCFSKIFFCKPDTTPWRNVASTMVSSVAAVALSAYVCNLLTFDFDISSLVKNHALAIGGITLLKELCKPETVMIPTDEETTSIDRKKIIADFIQTRVKNMGPNERLMI